MSAIDSRDSIYSVARSVAYATTPSATQQLDFVQEGQGDGDRNAVAGAVGQSRPGGLLQGMLQSLDQLGLKASSQINPNADVTAPEPQLDQSPARLEFRAFTQSLLQVLDQFNRSAASEAIDAGAESQNGEFAGGYGAESPFGDLSNNLRSLAVAIATGGAAGMPGTAELQTSFESLVARLSQENETDSAVRAQASGMEALPSVDEQQVSLSNFLANLSETLVTQRGATDLEVGKTGMLIDQTV